MRLIDADGSYTLNASDNTDYSLCFGGGIISVIDKHGHIACEFFADDAPTIDAVPVVHGRWVVSDLYPPTCSVCNLAPPTPGYVEDMNFYERYFECCPHCGAKMDEVSE